MSANTTYSVNTLKLLVVLLSWEKCDTQVPDLKNNTDFELKRFQRFCQHFLFFDVAHFKIPNVPNATDRVVGNLGGCRGRHSCEAREKPRIIEEVLGEGWEGLFNKMLE
jgi:hypothetical protein